MQWIYVRHDRPYEMFYKYSSNENIPFNEVNISKRKRNDTTVLQLLYPTGRRVDEAKYQDLQSLLPFVPPVHHSFYTNILTSATVQDIGLADAFSDNDED